MNESPNHDRLYQIAESQAGYFTSAQARATGFSTSLVTYHTRTDRFQRVAPRIYRLSHFPASSHEDLFVAWLRFGPDAVVSHDSVLSLYELSDALPSQIHITAPRTTSRRRQGIRLHTNRLDQEDVTRYAGLPVTTVPRTIADVTSTGLADELVLQAIEQALARGLTTPVDLQILTEKRGGRVARLIAYALQQEANS